MLFVTLECPFFIVPSVFSNVYLKLHHLQSSKLYVYYDKIFKGSPILSFKLVFRRYQHLVDKYSVTCVQITNDDIASYILVQI